MKSLIIVNPVTVLAAVLVKWPVWSLTLQNGVECRYLFTPAEGTTAG